MDEGRFDRIVRHLVTAIEAAEQHENPFAHLQIANVFPAELYAAMLEAMPAAGDYRAMSGRTKGTRTETGEGARVKIDLFPEYIRHLPAGHRELWTLVGRVLCSTELRDALLRRLSSSFGRRFGASYRNVGLYPIPILTCDVPGYRVCIHPDTPWKGLTMQVYLPPDRSIEHVGTLFHRRAGENDFDQVLQMLFTPNTGYAFAVGTDTFHSVDVVGSEVARRDSILLTYFVDKTPVQVMRNRSRRLGNFVLNEIRALRPLTHPRADEGRAAS